jgi:trehalose phosphatase
MNLPRCPSAEWLVKRAPGSQTLPPARLSCGIFSATKHLRPHSRPETFACVPCPCQTEVRQARNREMREHIVRCDAEHWARSFLHDLISRSSLDRVPVDAESGAMSGQLAHALSENRPVALFLDYDGTLREIESDPRLAQPTSALHALFHRLGNWPNLLIAIISGRAQEDLETWLGAYPFVLIAEHGASVRRPGQKAWAESPGVAVCQGW